MRLVSKWFSMAKIHNLTSDKTIDRVSYGKKSLVEEPYEYLNQFFSDKLPEMEFIKEFGQNFRDSDFDKVRKMEFSYGYFV